MENPSPASPQAALPRQEQPAQRKLPKPKKKRKWLKRLIILLLLAAVAVFFVLRLGDAGRQLVSNAYIPAAAKVQDLTVSVSSSGTVRPIDSYRVTALVRGEILDAPFEEGDAVREGDLLFQIDAKEVQNSIQRAELTVEQARLTYNDLLKNKGESQKNLGVKATASGVVQKLYCQAGDMLTVGSPIADILDKDSMLLTVAFHAADAASLAVGQSAVVAVDGAYEPLSGTIDSIALSDEAGAGGTLLREVTIRVPNPGALAEGSTGTAWVGEIACAQGGAFTYAARETVVAKTSGELSSLVVSEGDRVTKEQLIASFKATDMDVQIENARISLQSAELSLQSVKDQLESYTITSPISGTVIEKNYKAGDNVDPSTAAAGAGYMAVIYDMSTLTFEMSINELDINKISVGQTVQITSAALEGQSFTGKVDRININGVTVGSSTSYPVTVVIDDADDLLPGMNVSAQIVTDQVKDVLTVPIEAVERGAGVPQVTVAPPEALNEDATLVVDPSKLETRTVELGRSDEENVEIVSGLREGEVVVYINQVSSLFSMLQGG